MADIDSSDYVFIPGNGESPKTVTEIKSWLNATDTTSPASEYQKHLNSHIPTTGQWILETDQYRRWMDDEGDQGALWIRGIPGSGKSVVAASFVSRFQTQTESPVLFFFFRQIIVSNRTPRSLVQDFASGLLPHSPQLQWGLTMLMDEHSTVAAVPFEDLWECVSSALVATRKVYCVVDALDEMEEGHDDFIITLIGLSTRNPNSIKLILTSRQLLYLEERFRSTSGLIDLRLDRRNVDQDIARYIAHKLKTHRLPVTSDEAATIENTICNRGQGLFLYARLMLDQLLSQPEDIMANLARLPDGLGNMYTDILREHATLSGTTRTFQGLVLQWITHAARPLRLLELATAIDSLPDRGGLRPHQDTKVAVRTTCGPLLELCEDGVIQIMHHSLTEFLRNPELSHVRRIGHTSDEDDMLVLDSPRVHGHISQTCIEYLLGGCCEKELSADKYGSDYDYDLEVGKRTLRFPFLQYAAQYWPLHATQAEGPNFPRLRTGIDNLLRNKQSEFETWRDIWAGDNHTINDTASPLHIAAYCGLRESVEGLIQHMDVNIADDGDQTPLGYAAMAGHPDIVTLLLQQGARHDKVDNSGLGAIHHAAMMNCPSVIHALVEAGADPLLPQWKGSSSSRSNAGRTALFYACTYGHVEALEELQSTLSAHHLRNGPVHWAAKDGKSNILRALLQDPEVRLGIDDRDGDGNTPLYLAAHSHAAAAVKVLLDHGADVSVVSYDPRRRPHWQVPESEVHCERVAPRISYFPLHGWAGITGTSSDRGSRGSSIQNMQQTIRLLVGAGCDINARDHEGRTALFASRDIWDFQRSREYALAMVSELLALGADATVTDFGGNTPLHSLGRHVVHREIIRILCTAGADINAARKSDGRTFPMSMINSDAWLDLSSLDSDFNLKINFDLQDVNGDTAAHLSARYSTKSHHCIAIANPELRNNAGETVLHCLVQRSNDPSTISILLDKGFTLESQDYDGRTILLACLGSASFKEVEPTVKELLRLGANPQATDYTGKSALHYIVAGDSSCENGDREDIDDKLNFLGLLITAGADMNAIDHHGNTILHDSFAQNEPWRCAQISARAVLELGVPTGLRNHQGRTILHMAAMLDDHSISSTEDDMTGTKGRLALTFNPQLGLDVNGPDHEGATPLHLAASVSEINSWMLIQAGANIQARTHKGETPLHFASRAGQCNIVGLLIELYRENSFSINSRDLVGRTALYEATRSGRPESVKLLLDAGADPSTYDRYGQSLLHAAARFETPSQHREKPWRCHQCGDMAYRCKPSSCHQDKGAEKPGPLHQMSLIIQDETQTHDIREVVRLLIDAGTNPAHLDEREYTATDVALMLGSSAVVDELSGVMLDVYQDRRGEGRLLPIDPLGESMCSVTEERITSITKAVEVPEDKQSFFKRLISTRSRRLVEGMFRYSGLRLIQEDSTSVLCWAARWGLVSMMKTLLPFTADLNTCYPAVMTAAANRALPNIEMIKVLVEQREIIGEDFPSSVADAMQILAGGGYWWHTAALECLLEVGVDPNVKNDEGETPLHCALAAGETHWYHGEIWSHRTLEILLKYHPDVNLVSQKSGLAPLNIAIEHGKDLGVLKELLEHGADVSLGTKPALFSAIKQLNIPAVKLCLEAGANPNAMVKYESFSAYDDRKKVDIQTALEYAACVRCRGESSRREEIMTILLEHGADPHLSLGNGQSTPLHEISAMGGIVNPIVRANCDLEQRDGNGLTPLARACSFERRWFRSGETQPTANDLIQGGADLSARDEAGLTPLHLAAWYKEPRAAKALLQNSACVAAKDNRGFTPLYYAFIDRKGEGEKYVNVDIINHLLDAGATPLERGPNGQTALHFLAAQLMHKGYKSHDGEGAGPQCAQLYHRLIGAGCDCEARDDAGNTPVFNYVAAAKIYYEDVETPIPPTVEDMRAVFADHDIHAVNNAGDTLLHVVARRDDHYNAIQDAPAIFKLLVQLGLNPWRENNAGATPLDDAHVWKHKDILAMYSRDDDKADSLSQSSSKAGSTTDD